MYHLDVRWRARPQAQGDVKRRLRTWSTGGECRGRLAGQPVVGICRKSGNLLVVNRHHLDRIPAVERGIHQADEAMAAQIEQ
jgi:hypothetical protein